MVTRASNFGRLRACLAIVRHKVFKGCPMRLLVVLLVALACLAAMPVAARQLTPLEQSFAPAGLWLCQKTSQTARGNPSDNYSWEAEIALTQDRGAIAKGALYNVNLQRAVQPFTGQGSWQYIYSAEHGHAVVIIRLATPQFGVISFWSRPIGPGQMYLPYSEAQVQQYGFFVETNCQRTG